MTTRRLYLFTRDLHLYFGLFIAPLILLFAISAILMVHSRAPGAGGSATRRTVTNLALPAALEDLKGREQVDALRGVLEHIGVAGEIDSVRHVSKEHRLIVPVRIPGRETTVDLDLASRSAATTERNTGVADSITYLHKMPGPHNAAIRGNSLYMRVWRWFADGTAYVLLFLSISGVYLWAVLRAERRIGFALLAAGAVTFFGMVYALAH